jgi:hypothetical protein
MSEATEMYYKQKLVMPDEPELSNRILLLETKLVRLEHMLNQLITQNTIPDSQMVSVKNDGEQDYMDIEFQNLELDKYYLVQYHGETYAVRKISQDHLAFYDVIK